MEIAFLRQQAIRWRAGVALGLVNAPGRIGLLYGGTDKVEHGYMAYYRRHLRHRRLRRNLLFEIGVGGVPTSDDPTGYEREAPGGSLALWRDYLPRSAIVGVDLSYKDVRLGSSVRFAQADQGDAAAMGDLVSTYGRPNIVIDDGSHIASHITATFNVLWPALEPGGLYVIEDLSTSYYPSFEGAASPSPTTGVGLAQTLAGDVQAMDPTFINWAFLGSRPPPAHAEVGAVHTYPGIAFIEKASA